MPEPISASVIGGSLITGIGGYMSQKSAAEEASGAQREASQAAIAEQRRQQAEMERLLAPYMQAGQGMRSIGIADRVLYVFVDPFHHLLLL